MEEYKRWVEKAEDDLAWTSNNINGKIYYGACFTAQQAAEKALKAFLSYRKQPIKKMHDTRALLELCIQLDTDFEVMREQAASLTSYYIETRYPMFEELSSFSQKNAQEALKYAEDIVEMVKKRLNNSANYNSSVPNQNNW